MKRFCVAALLFWTGPALAETDFRALTDAERQVLRAEIRAVILGNPSLINELIGVPQATYPTPAYEEEIAADHALIARHADALFDGDLPGFGDPDASMKIALFIADECPDCQRAKEELLELSKGYNVKVMLIDRNAHGDLADALGVGDLPFYVMPRMMIQGHMPAPVLTRYLEDGTGQ